MSHPTSDPATTYAAGAVSRNPATDELIATYPYQTPAEVEATLSANVAALRQWRDKPVAEGAQRIARRLETGDVFISDFGASNARIPVGGVKKSGYRRELSHFGLREFTAAEAIWTKFVGQRDKGFSSGPMKG